MEGEPTRGRLGSVRLSVESSFPPSAWQDVHAHVNNVHGCVLSPVGPCITVATPEIMRVPWIRSAVSRTVSETPIVALPHQPMASCHCARRHAVGCIRDACDACSPPSMHYATCWAGCTQMLTMSSLRSKPRCAFTMPCCSTEEVPDYRLRTHLPPSLSLFWWTKAIMQLSTHGNLSCTPFRT